MYSVLLLFISFGISDCQQWVVSENRMNWRDAVKFCREKNATLFPHSIRDPPHNVIEYWTVTQQRMSPWIRSVGCFNETLIQPWMKSSVTLPSSSVVLCQQRCSRFPYFGLKDSWCVCLNEFYYETTDAIDSRLCNISCSQSPNVVLSECGGLRTYNIYKPGDLTFDGEGNDNKTCLAISCSMNEFQLPINCSGPNIRCRCTGDGACTTGNAFNLEDCFKYCNSSGKQIYFDDDDDYVRIQPLQSGSIARNIAWTGVSKEIFISLSVDSMNSNSFLLQCLSCNIHGCAFANCSERRYAICNKHITDTSSTPGSSSSTSTSDSTTLPEQPSSATSSSTIHSSSKLPTTISSKSPATNTTTTSLTRSSTAKETSTGTPSSLGNYQDHGDIIQTVIAVVFSLVAVSFFIGITIFCIRKKICHHKGQDGPRIRDKSELVSYDEIRLSELKPNTNGTVVNDNHFVLESEQKSVKEEILQDNDCYDHLGDVDKEKGYTNSHLYTSTTEFTAQQNDSGDELYNHLWEKSPGPVEDVDIYSHVTPEDDYEYSTPAKEELKRTSNYDHVVLNENNSIGILRNGKDQSMI